MSIAKKKFYSITLILVMFITCMPVLFFATTQTAYAANPVCKLIADGQEREFTMLHQAFSAAENYTDSKIVLLSNTVYVNGTVYNKAKVTLDLAGHRIVADSYEDEYGDPQYDGVYVIENEGELTITDSSEGGTGWIGRDDDDFELISVINNTTSRKLTINSGTIDGDTASHAIESEGTLKINGGKITGVYTEAVLLLDGSCEITDGKFKGALRKGETGGAYSISGGLFNQSLTESYIADGYVQSNNEDAETKGEYPYTVLAVPQYFTVSWMDQAGETVLGTSTILKGDKPTKDFDDPTKPGDAEAGSYAFKGWASEAGCTSGTKLEDLPAVTGDTTYYAAFEPAYILTLHFSSIDGDDLVDPIVVVTLFVLPVNGSM